MAVKKYILLFSGMLYKNMRESTSYKLDFVVGVLAHLIIQISSLFCTIIVYNNVDTLGGFDFGECLILLGCYLLPTGIEEFFLHNVWSISKHVHSGSLDSYLTKPANTLFLLVMDGTNIHGFILTICGIFYLIFGIVNTNIYVGWWKFIWLIICVISGAFIIFSITVFMETLSFWFTEVTNATVMIDSLRQLVRYPITMFHPFLQKFLIFVVPYAYTSFFSATLLFDLGKYMCYTYATPVVAMVMVMGAKKFFDFGLKNYSSPYGS